jgi:hypothetical protein
MAGVGSYRQLMPTATPCRSCQAPVFFVRLSSTRKWMPLDTTPSDAGNVVLEDGPREARTLGPEEAATYKGRRYVTHFMTCPDAKFWRRSRGIPEPTLARDRGE